MPLLCFFVSKPAKLWVDEAWKASSHGKHLAALSKVLQTSPHISDEIVLKSFVVVMLISHTPSPPALMSPLMWMIEVWQNQVSKSGICVWISPGKGGPRNIWKTLRLEKWRTYGIVPKFNSFHSYYALLRVQMHTNTVVNVYANLYHSCTHFKGTTSENNTLLVILAGHYY